MGARTGVRVEIVVPAGVALWCEVGGRRYAVGVARDPNPPHDDVPMVGSLGPALKRAKRRRRASLEGTLFAGTPEPASGVETLPPPILVLVRNQRDLDRAYAVANRLSKLGYHADARIDHDAEGGGHGAEEAEEGAGAEAEEDPAVHDAELRPGSGPAAEAVCGVPGGA